MTLIYLFNTNLIRNETNKMYTVESQLLYSATNLLYVYNILLLGANFHMWTHKCYSKVLIIRLTGGIVIIYTVRVPAWRFFKSTESRQAQPKSMAISAVLIFHSHRVHNIKTNLFILYYNCCGCAFIFIL